VSPDQVVFLSLASIAIGGVLLFPLIRALADRIRTRGDATALTHDVADELAGLRRDVAELPALRQEVSELAERLDFAERLLARQKEGDRLGPGSAR
jgi:Tfp pilus assembly protein PilO